MKHTYRSISKKIVIFLITICLAVAVISPLIWMVSSSLKDQYSVFSNPFEIVPEVIHWQNYIKIWEEVDLHIYLFNSIKLCIIVVILQVILTSMAAYAFAKVNFPKRDMLFLFYVLTLTIPFHVIMIPQFILIKKLHMPHPYIEMVLVFAFNPLGIFLFRQFFKNIPDDYLDNARIDGLSEFKIYYKILLPLAIPAAVILSIFTAIAVWNDFIVALIYVYRDVDKTIQLGVHSFFANLNVQYHLCLSVSVVSIVPVLLFFIFSQRFFMEGITMTGLKV